MKKSLFANAIVPTLTAKLNQQKISQKKWLKVMIELAVVVFDIWLNPSAGGLLMLLKLCLQILYARKTDDDKRG